MQLSTLAFALVAGSAHALCPDACSGHGTCGQYDKCTCYSNYQGNNCAYKTCPFTPAWSDTVITTRNPHYYAECGNRGVCNRDSGVCECLEGYEGKGCARLSCVEGCSGHGTCETMLEMNTGYAQWDKDKIMHCKCDPGYEGIDCSQRMCMNGDDPMSVQKLTNAAQPQAAEVQTIMFASADNTNLPGGEILLAYTDWRNEKWFTYPIALGAETTAIMVEEALEALPNHAIPSVTVTGPDATKKTDDKDLEFTITFSSPANSGNQVSLEVLKDGCDVDGCQPRWVAASNVDTPTVTPVDGTTEGYRCSGRGECDSDTGTCTCYEGYHGQACEGQTIII